MREGIGDERQGRRARARRCPKLTQKCRLREVSDRPPGRRASGGPTSGGGPVRGRCFRVDVVEGRGARAPPAHRASRGRSASPRFSRRSRREASAPRSFDAAPLGSAPPPPRPSPARLVGDGAARDDPFYPVKEEISESVTKAGSIADRMHRLPDTNGERYKHAGAVATECEACSGSSRSSTAQGMAERDFDRFKVDAAELASRRRGRRTRSRGETMRADAQGVLDARRRAPAPVGRAGRFGRRDRGEQRRLPRPRARPAAAHHAAGRQPTTSAPASSASGRSG